MKIKLLSSISIAVLSGLLVTANAADFDYNYVEGAYQDIDLNGLDSEAFNISGSYGLTPKFNILADFTNGETSDPTGGSDLGFDKIDIGLGFHTGIGPATDFTANIKVLSQDMDLIGDDTGYGIGVGVRHMITDKIEVGSNIDFVDIYDTEDTAFKVDSRYYFNEKASMGLSFSTSSEEVDVISGGVRFNF